MNLLTIFETIIDNINWEENDETIMMGFSFKKNKRKRIKNRLKHKGKKLNSFLK